MANVDGAPVAGGDDVVPAPDPTRLTTAQLEREINHLRELIEAQTNQVSLHLDAADAQMDQRFTLQLSDMRRQIAEKFRQQESSVASALLAADKAVVALDIATTRRIDSVQDLNESKFVTYRTLLDSQAEKVALALAAATTAVAKQEAYVEVRLTLIAAEINELKDYRSAASGRGAGAAQLWVVLAGAAGLLVAAVSLALAAMR